MKLPTLSMALLLCLWPAIVEPQSQPTPSESGVERKEAGEQVAVSPPDSITVPDGTPLTLQLMSELSSANAKVGDSVEFRVPHPFRIDGLVVIPRGTHVSGTVVLVTHPHRPTKNGEVRMAIEKVVLPNGEVMPLRPSRSTSGKPQSMAAEHEKGDPGLWLLMAPIDPLGWVVAPAMLFTKGHEAFYPAGTQITVFFNGPLNLDRGAILRWQPPPYKGPPQVLFNDFSAPHVFFTDVSASATRVCGRVLGGDVSVPLRLELNPGTYSFSTGREDERTVKLELHEGQKYWIQGARRGLFTRDPQKDQVDFESLEADLRLVDKDFTQLPPQASCPQAGQP